MHTAIIFYNNFHLCIQTVCLCKLDGPCHNLFLYKACVCVCVCLHYLPVVVEVAQLVGEPLHVVGLEAAAVVHHVVVSGRDAAHTHSLTHDEEVIPEEEGRDTYFTLNNIEGTQWEKTE